MRFSPWLLTTNGFHRFPGLTTSTLYCTLCMYPWNWSVSGLCFRLFLIAWGCTIFNSHKSSSFKLTINPLLTIDHPSNKHVSSTHVAIYQHIPHQNLSIITLLPSNEVLCYCWSRALPWGQPRPSWTPCDSRLDKPLRSQNTRPSLTFFRETSRLSRLASDIADTLRYLSPHLATTSNGNTTNPTTCQRKKAVLDGETVTAKIVASAVTNLPR